MKKHVLIRVLTLVFILFSPLIANSASVWTLTGITDSTNGDTWNLHMVSTSDMLVTESVTGVYLDNLSDGSVDLNYLVNNSTANIRTAFAGSAEDMATNYSEFNYPSSYFHVGGTLVNAETMINVSLFSESDQPLYDSAFFSNIQIESSGASLGYGRIDNDYDAVWSISDSTATRTALSSVPVPAAVWLFGSGLISLVGFARRKRA